MTTRLRLGLCISALTFLLTAGASAVAQEPKPDATLEIEQTDVKLLIGGGWGGGKLHFKGETYDFKTGGLVIGGVGITKISATGEVYNLKKVEDFPGLYSQGQLGITIGIGRGMVGVKNDNDVVLRLKTKSKGVDLSVAAGGLNIKMD